MTRSQDAAQRVLQALLRDVAPGARDDLALRFGLCVHQVESNGTHELLTVDPNRLIAASRKSSNALLDIPRFLRMLGELAVEGTAMYQAPFLFVPIALRMMHIGRDAVTRELGHPSTALLLALHEAPSLGTDTPKLNARAAEILAKAGLPSADATTLSRALQWLQHLRCVSRRSDGRIELSETVELSVDTTERL